MKRAVHPKATWKPFPVDDDTLQICYKYGYSVASSAASSEVFLTEGGKNMEPYLGK